MLEPNTGSIHPYTLRYFMLNLRCDMQHFCIETSKNDRTLVLHHQCLNPDTCVIAIEVMVPYMWLPFATTFIKL